MIAAGAYAYTTLVATYVIPAIATADTNVASVQQSIKDLQSSEKDNGVTLTEIADKLNIK